MVVGGRELIDTLWNVNSNWYNKSFPPTLRINRYIMECKYLLCFINLCFAFELIDTLWNVNKISIVLPFGIPPN